MTHERGKNLEFGWSQIKELVILGRGMRFEVQNECIGAQDGRRLHLGRGRPADMTAAH